MKYLYLLNSWSNKAKYENIIINVSYREGVSAHLKLNLTFSGDLEIQVNKQRLAEFKYDDSFSGKDIDIPVYQASPSSNFVLTLFGNVTSINRLKETQNDNTLTSIKFTCSNTKLNSFNYLAIDYNSIYRDILGDNFNVKNVKLDFAGIYSGQPSSIDYVYKLDRVGKSEGIIDLSGALDPTYFDSTKNILKDRNYNLLPLTNE